MQGKDRHELIDDAEPDAERALRREAALEAVADAEGIEAGDEDLLEALGPGEGKNDPSKLLERLRETGRDGLLRDEVRLRRPPTWSSSRRSRSRSSRPPRASRSGRPTRRRPRAAKSAGGRQPEPGKLWTPG